MVTGSRGQAVRHELVTNTKDANGSKRRCFMGGYSQGVLIYYLIGGLMTSRKAYCCFGFESGMRAMLDFEFSRDR